MNEQEKVEEHTEENFAERLVEEIEKEENKKFWNQFERYESDIAFDEKIDKTTKSNGE